MFLSEDTDVFGKSANLQTFYFLNLKIWILVSENCLQIEDVLKFGSLEACKGKKVGFCWLGQT